MDGGEGRRQTLVRLEEVTQVGAGVVGAGVAVATLVDGREVRLEARVGDVVAAGGGVDGCVACHAGGGDAVEGVHAVLDADEDVVGFGDTEQVAGLGLGQLFGAPAHDGTEVFLLKRATDAEAVEGHGAEVLASLAAQVLVLGALNHSEQCLVGLAHALSGQTLVLSDAPQRPQAGTLECLFLVAAGVVEGGQLVEGEHDVGTNLVLNLHGHLGSEAVNRAVNMRLEVHAVVVNVGEAFLALRHVVVAEGAAVGALSVRDGTHVDNLLETGTQAHHLEAAGVGEGGAVPVHESTQAACRIQDFGAGL